ncbi:hypothetical protein [Moorena producens]|uniref:hypothetical protein n=1 Tax=Moorena producens TaxID=1155739 RepID=UPI001314987C|nr:hypothetical protein [Moorena producens]
MPLKTIKIAIRVAIEMILIPIPYSLFPDPLFPCSLFPDPLFPDPLFPVHFARVV